MLPVSYYICYLTTRMKVVYQMEAFVGAVFNIFHETI